MPDSTNRYEDKFKKKLCNAAIDLLMSDKELLARLIIDKYSDEIVSNIDFDVKSFVKKYIDKTLNNEREKIIENFSQQIKAEAQASIESIKKDESNKILEITNNLRNIEQSLKDKIHANGLSMTDAVDRAIERSKNVIDNLVIVALETSREVSCLGTDAMDNLKNYIANKFIESLKNGKK